MATVLVPFKKGQWGKMHRTGIRDRRKGDPEEARATADV